MKPNVVLINMDDMGYGDLGCYGSQCNDSPHIDKLAAEGVTFSDFYACSTICSPSRAGLMTGCYPARVNINRVLFPAEKFGLNPSEYTLANLFKDAGYATTCIGKWHCGDQPGSLPCDFGFDHYFGLPYSNDMGKQVGAQHPCLVNAGPEGCALPLMHDDEVIEGQPDQRSLTARYVEHAKAFIRQNTEKPFFLYFAQMHVHLPLYAAQCFVDKSRNGDFGACVLSADWAVGQIVAELEKKGLMENTVVIFTSDNGSRAADGASNAPLRGAKFSTFEGGQRVPFIIKWAGHTPVGTHCDKMGSNIDLLPTFAEIIGQPLPQHEIDGVSLVPSMLYNEASRTEFVYFAPSNTQENNHDECSTPAAIRIGQYKRHQYQQREVHDALYDLATDIGETENVLAQHPEIAAECDARLAYWSARLGNEEKGVKGDCVRNSAIYPNAKYLLPYDEEHEYIVELYDKAERG
ncbi:MAG: sulfatase [Faecalibacterium sp.]